MVETVIVLGKEVVMILTDLRRVSDRHVVNERAVVTKINVSGFGGFRIPLHREGQERLKNSGSKFDSLD